MALHVDAQGIVYLAEGAGVSIFNLDGRLLSHSASAAVTSTTACAGCGSTGMATSMWRVMPCNLLWKFGGCRQRRPAAPSYAGNRLRSGHEAGPPIHHATTSDCYRQAAPSAGHLCHREMSGEPWRRPAAACIWRRQRPQAVPSNSTYGRRSRWTATGRNSGSVGRPVERADAAPALCPEPPPWEWHARCSPRPTSWAGDLSAFDFHCGRPARILALRADRVLRTGRPAAGAAGGANKPLIV